MSKHTPMSAIDSCVYLDGMAGGFDVSGCPDSEELASFIVKACNNHDRLVAELKEAREWIISVYGFKPEFVKQIAATVNEMESK